MGLLYSIIDLLGDIMTKSDELWTEIQQLPMDMWGLSNQRVKDHVEKLAGTGEQLYLKLSAPAVLPALETALAARQQFVVEDSYERHHQGEDVEVPYPMYTLQEVDNYVVVTRFIPPTVKKELQPDVFISEKKAEQSERSLAEVVVADKEEK